MEIKQSMVNNVIIINISGRLEYESEKYLREEIKSLIEKGMINIVLDLSYVDFIDSSGIGCLVASKSSTNKADGDLKISGLQPRVKKVFDLTRVYLVFEIFGDSLTAAYSFKK